MFTPPASRWQVVITPAWRRVCSNQSAKPAASEPADLRSCWAIPQSRQPAIAEQQLKQRTRMNAATAADEPLRRLAASGALRWGHGLGRSWRELPPVVGAALAEALSDLEDRLRILDALYIPTRYPDSLPDGAPSDHFGRLQSDDAQRHARSIVDAITTALA